MQQDTFCVFYVHFVEVGVVILQYGKCFDVAKISDDDYETGSGSEAGIVGRRELHLEAGAKTLLCNEVVGNLLLDLRITAIGHQKAQESMISRIESSSGTFKSGLIDSCAFCWPIAVTHQTL